MAESSAFRFAWLERCDAKKLAHTYAPYLPCSQHLSLTLTSEVVASCQVGGTTHLFELVDRLRLLVDGSFAHANPWQGITQPRSLGALSNRRSSWRRLRQRMLTLESLTLSNSYTEQKLAGMSSSNFKIRIHLRLT